jgi:hypothetical protein
MELAWCLMSKSSVRLSGKLSAIFRTANPAEADNSETAGPRLVFVQRRSEHVQILELSGENALQMRCKM